MLGNHRANSNVAYVDHRRAVRKGIWEHLVFHNVQNAHVEEAYAIVLFQ